MTSLKFDVRGRAYDTSEPVFLSRADGVFFDRLDNCLIAQADLDFLAASHPNAPYVYPPEEVGYASYGFRTANANQQLAVNPADPDYAPPAAPPVVNQETREPPATNPETREIPVQSEPVKLPELEVE